MIETIVEIVLGLFIVYLALGWYFIIVYAPFIKKTQENHHQKSQIPSVPRTTLALLEPSNWIFGLNGGFGPLHQAAEINDIQKLKNLIQDRSFYYEGALEETARRTSRLGSVCY
eukprot:TRINITY_DN1473_c0_g1_i1.p1 TRINITY_DN1473_c0_g1~~TRINITY_DN1473_c0_g1_i1.p1  ORF type:complete len:114 (+),score=7.50 TRINITY_DN1473_c0_g1_i1:91-432(+)